MSKKYGLNFEEESEGVLDKIMEEKLEEPKQTVVKESEPKQEKKKPKKNQNRSKFVKVVVLRTHVLAEANPHSKYLCGVVKGTRLKVLSSNDEWYEVEVPRANKQNLVGFVLSSKVAKG